jgi:hypothetical protein
MTAILIGCGLFVFGGVALYSIRKGYTLRAALHWIGIELTFEAERPSGAMASNAHQPTIDKPG